MSKQERDLVKLAAKYGLIVQRARRNAHFQLVRPGGGLIATAPSSPSDWRSMRNLEQSIKRSLA